MTKRKIDYKDEFYALLIFALIYPLVTLGVIAVLGGGVVSVVSAMVTAVPFYLVWRFILIR